MVADICISDESSAATPGVAASLAVLAGIAAADAATCSRLGHRSRDQQHARAASVIRMVEPGGKAMSQLLADLLSAKDDSHYGVALMSSRKATGLVRKAHRLVAWAEDIVRL